MARRKSDAEVGTLGVWAYNTRDALDLSVEEAVAALPTAYHPATLRKVEGGSARPGTRMWRELDRLYARVAQEKGIDIEPQPRLRPEPPQATETPDSVLAAVRLLLDEIRAERAERQEWERGFLEAMRELAIGAARRDDPAPELPVTARR
jgi:hypothetical protein